MGDRSDRLEQLRIDRSVERNGLSGRTWVLIGVAAIALALGAFWIFGPSRAPEVAVARVTAAAGDRSARVSVLDASGYVTARLRATVSSKLTGKIAEVLVEEGMRVEKGQILARLDDAIVVRQVALADALLSVAKSSLREIEVRRAEARRNLDRFEDLAQKSVVSQSELDTRAAEYDSLSSRLVAAEGDVAVAERQLALRRQELEDTLIRAPFAGIAISKNAQPGEMISPVSAGGGFTRTGISTIVDMSSLEIEVDVNEAYINRVTPGQRVVATLDAYPEWSIPAHVITTIPTANRQKATFRVRIGFDELSDARILPEMGVKVSFRAEEDPVESAGVREASVLLIPSDAVVTQSGRSIVFVLDGETVERRAVTIGGTAGDRVEVRAGLRDGERVVLDPPPALEDGTEVRIR